MALVTTKEMFKKAYEGGYAIGAFNINNMEILQGIVDAAEETGSNVIVQVSSSALKYARPTYLKKLVEAAVEDSTIDIALHLDHGADFEACKTAVDLGFTSVMIDGSHHDFEGNIAVTKEVVEYAHSKGVVVEAELGRLAGVEDEVNVSAEDSSYTDPQQAKEFVEKTGVDSLAIAIGTSHGANKFSGEPKLEFGILKEIMELLPNFPLVLHGASSVYPEAVQLCNDNGGELKGACGVPDEMLREANRLGVCKINVDTDLRIAFTGQVRKAFNDNPANFDPRKYLGPARDEIKRVVAHKMINVFGSNTK
ncbi:class II fructose-1,6-bisphosphate aldolase [Acidaminobacter sp. JC074]|uniref:class II fructose-1,6-bisphosphate aldolase n=1 Tax=Acidaminobacter sp. JC074 TaxID=2530199 RepID=UPI001F108985|nr:class II fructose-1,6-bisphosphate aldolase [Acidaminobacter sp. JC074]MCH4890389.1 class II fructose-1,6-bisphosphate aldolase [Acidaminobacter sp. JC074]